MAGSRVRDPFTAFRFAIEIDGIQGGFSECTGIGLQTEVFEYQEGGVNDSVHKLPTRVKQGNLTLKRGIVDSSLWTWYASAMPGKVQLKTGSIKLQDARGTTVMTWRFTKAFPCKVQGADLNAGQSNVAVETLEICHGGLTVV